MVACGAEPEKRAADGFAFYADRMGEIVWRCKQCRPLLVLCDASLLSEVFYKEFLENREFTHLLAAQRDLRNIAQFLTL